MQIGGVEWTFAGGAGVFYSDDPKTAPGATYRESIELGDFAGSSRDVDRIIDSLRPRFQSDSYNLINKNCNSFADAFVQQLLGSPIPPYVNRLAYFGSFVPQCLLPPQLTNGEAPVEGPSDSGGYNSSGRKYGSGNISAPPVNAFSGSAMKLGSQSGGEAKVESVDSKAEKERARNARLAAIQKRAAINQ